MDAFDGYAAEVVDPRLLDESQELLPGFCSEPPVLRNILRGNKSHRDATTSRRSRGFATDEPATDDDRGSRVRTRGA